jgi:hypothetical protein
MKKEMYMTRLTYPATDGFRKVSMIPIPFYELDPSDKFLFADFVTTSLGNAGGEYDFGDTLDYVNLHFEWNRDKYTDYKTRWFVVLDHGDKIDIADRLREYHDWTFLAHFSNHERQCEYSLYEIFYDSEA